MIRESWQNLSIKITGHQKMGKRPAKQRQGDRSPDGWRTEGTTEVRLCNSRLLGRSTQGQEAVKTLENKWSGKRPGQSEGLAETGQQGAACKASQGSGPGRLPSLSPPPADGRVRVSG